jgi:hypothetical protein
VYFAQQIRLPLGVIPKMGFWVHRASFQSRDVQEDRDLPSDIAAAALPQAFRLRYFNTRRFFSIPTTAKTEAISVIATPAPTDMKKSNRANVKSSAARKKQSSGCGKLKGAES